MLQERGLLDLDYCVAAKACPTWFKQETCCDDNQSLLDYFVNDNQNLVNKQTYLKPFNAA